jgi:mannose-6-phosphate isomerase-like protein (cupin superfamily)
MADPINIAAKHALFDDAWNPRMVGRVNGTAVKLVKLRGEFTWHKHDIEDEMFLVTKGVMRMRFRDRDKLVSEGEFIIVPHGVEHCPVAESGEVHAMLIEPDTTLNTGDSADARRRDVLEEI